MLSFDPALAQVMVMLVIQPPRNKADFQTSILSLEIVIQPQIILLKLLA